MDLEQIDTYFPMPSYRDGQREAIEFVLKSFEDGNRYTIIEAPTGSGKSAIAFTASRFYESSYWITIQKTLQDQLVDDFGEDGKNFYPSHEVVDIKGRNAYGCNYYARKLADPETSAEDKDKFLAKLSNGAPTADVGFCKSLGKSKVEYCQTSLLDSNEGCYSHCPYFQRKAEAIKSPVCLMNFSSFLFQTTMTEDFGDRKLMVIDECHNAESELLKFIEFSISDRYFRKQGLQFPEYVDPEDYAEYFESINLEDLIRQKMVASRLAGNLKEENDWEHRLMKYKNFMKTSDSGNWIVEYKRATHGSKDKHNFSTVVLKPIFIDHFAQRYLFSRADHILMMSATVLNPKILCNGLGIGDDEVKSYRMKNRFPKKRRQIFVQSVGSLNYKDKHETFPKLVEKVDKICSTHINHKGIIHTHNFEIANKILYGCDDSVKSRLLFQENFKDKQEMLEVHSKADNTIMIAPAMHEGLDLIGDLSRFQIICKVPFPSLGDPQIKARMNISHKFYDWLTAQKLVQAYGRSIRSETDWAITYILDEEFGRFKKRASKLLPEWFKEVINGP
jgi:Rad3-related DNA helicase